MSISPTTYALRYIFLAIGLLSALTNLIILLVEKMLRRTFCQALFIIQSSYFIMAILDITFDQSNNRCQYVGVIFYTVWLYSTTVTLYLLLWIYRLVSNHKTRLEKYKYYWAVVLFILCMASQLIKRQLFAPCGFDDYKFYCGVCGQTNQAWLQTYKWLLDYIIPTLFLIILILFFVHLNKTLKQSYLDNDQKLGLKVVYFPVFNVVFLLINMVTNLFMNITQNNQWNMFLNQLFYLIPVCNFFFFKNFMTDFRELHEIEFKYFGCLLNPEESDLSTVLSNDSD